MSVHKDKDGGWYCQFYYKDWTGQRKHTSKHGFTRKKDAQEYEKEFRERCQCRTASMAVLLEEYDRHLTSRVQLGSLKADTANQKRYTIRRYIQPYFGQTQDISTITPAVANNWLADTVDSKCAKGRKLAAGTLRGIRSELNQIFKLAIKNGLMKSNPLTLAEPIQNGGRKNKRAKMWTLEQYNTFHNAIHKEAYKIFFEVMFWGGLRIGETAALMPQDIHPYYISVRRTFKDGKNGGHFNTPKTKSSIRDVQIPRFLYYRLKHYIERLLIAPDDRIFPFSANAPRMMMNGLIAKLGLPLASPHTLRHSYASLLLNTTKDFTVVAAQMGHSNLQTTISTYSHMLPGSNRASVDKLEENFFPVKTIDVEPK